MSSTYKNIPDESSSEGVQSVVSESVALTISHPSNGVVGIAIDMSGIVAQSAASVVTTYTAGEVISAIKAVYAVGGTIFLANANSLQEASVVGITLTSGNPGDPIQVLQYGVLEDTMLGFTPADLLFVTNSGAISNTAPTSGYLTRLGRVITGNTALILIDSPKTL